jgi:hypothetical protein
MQMTLLKSTETFEKCQKFYEALVFEADKMGFVINEKKTKYMFM